MTLREISNEIAESFKTCPDIEAPLFEAKTLAASFFGLSPERFLVERERTLCESEISGLTELAERRISGEPLQYIVGEWDFCGMPMYCGKGCLIPRPETEQLVETAARMLPEGGRFIDLCTGSGCIAASLLSIRRDAVGVALDISEDALVYAKRNAERHGVSDRLEIVKSDLAEYAPREQDKFDLIVSNPPYVKTSDVDAFSKEMLHEPRIAFDGGEDGLEFYRLIIRSFSKQLVSGGAFIFEAGYDTTSGVASISREAGLSAEVLLDIHGLERICVARKE